MKDKINKKDLLDQLIKSNGRPSTELIKEIRANAQLEEIIILCDKLLQKRSLYPKLRIIK